MMVVTILNESADTTMIFNCQVWWWVLWRQVFPPSFCRRPHTRRCVAQQHCWHHHHHHHHHHYHHHHHHHHHPQGGQDFHLEEVPLRPVPAPALPHRGGDVQQGLWHQQRGTQVGIRKKDLLTIVSNAKTPQYLYYWQRYKTTTIELHLRQSSKDTSITIQYWQKHNYNDFELHIRLRLDLLDTSGSEQFPAMRRVAILSGII